VSTNSAPDAAWLTQESYDRLKSELEHLSGAGRTEIVARIEQARSEGDLKENGGYHAAKEEQGKAEARIRQLTHLLENAHVGEAPADNGVVEPGMMVSARIAGDVENFLLGSEKSPLGAAIQGKKAGDSVTYAAPNGKQITVEIISATPYVG
jgi:transcription elongation factor GreA